MFFREIYYFVKVFSQWFLNNKKKKQLQSFFLKNVLETASKIKMYDSFKFKQDSPLKNLSKFEIINKEILLKRKKLISIDKKNKILKKYTSGTTNNPLEIILNEESIDYSNCIFSRSLIFQGYNPLKKLGFYWYRKERNSYFNKLGFSRKVYINYNDPPKIILDKIILNKLKFIYIFPFKLLEFSSSLSDEETKKLKLKRIFTIGEILTPKMRRLFEYKFNCSVTNNYASSEFNIIAFQKPFTKEYFNNFDNVYLEFLKNKNFNYGNRNLYYPVITSLSNHLMPLIRYKIDDLVSLDKKKNIVRVFGKESYFLKFNDTIVYLGDLIDELLNFRKKIILFNFVLYQKDQLLLIKIKVTSNFKNGDKHKIVSIIKNKFKISKINLKVEKELLFLKGGKLKLIDIKG